MPLIIEYPTVLARMTAGGFRCNYHNSGAFGLAGQATPFIRGWIGPRDATIRPALMEHLRIAPPPHEGTLANAAGRAWRECVPGSVWVMPMSHWHFELHDGSRDWMPDALKHIGVDKKLLENRADGSALEFSTAEAPLFVDFLTRLLTNLRVSDFSLAFPGHPIIAMIHHHKQIWWSAAEPNLIAKLDAEAGFPSPL